MIFDDCIVFTGGHIGIHSIESYPPSKVLSFLYLGNSKNANDRDSMAAIGITHVLNVTASFQSPFPDMEYRASGIVYKRLHVLDNLQSNLDQYFEEAFEFIGMSPIYYVLLYQCPNGFIIIFIIFEQSKDIGGVHLVKKYNSRLKIKIRPFAGSIHNMRLFQVVVSGHR